MPSTTNNINTIDKEPPDLPEINDAINTQKEKNVVFAARTDKRDNTTIAKDINSNENTARQSEWSDNPKGHDLLGWDTTDLKEKQESFERLYPGVKGELQKMFASAPISGRVKSLESIVKKLKKKNATGEPFTDNNMEDYIGLRITVNDLVTIVTAFSRNIAHWRDIV